MAVTIEFGDLKRDTSTKQQFTRISRSLAHSKKVVVLVGAGISTSAGIPDFRSKSGLYGSSTPATSKALFSASSYSSQSALSAHLSTLSQLKSHISVASPTLTHTFFATLKRKGKLRRVYSQNIDGLERRAGLESVQVEGTFVGRKQSSCAGGSEKGKEREGDYVPLHGDLGFVRCTLCDYVGKWEGEIGRSFKVGETMDCPECLSVQEARRLSSKRLTPLKSFLRPSITLYNEPTFSSSSETISSLASHDLKSKPDLVLVCGTTLKIPGFKTLVKDFARAAKERGGTVVFVNAEKVGGKEWEDVFDFIVLGKTDDFVQRVTTEWKSLRPQDWERQTKLENQPINGFDSTKRSVVVSGKPSQPVTPSKRMPLSPLDLNSLPTLPFATPTTPPAPSFSTTPSTSPTVSGKRKIHAYVEVQKKRKVVVRSA
ncbi:DHS-like NAD/FAD-binding domain-containing protein [Meredithblackwellia eburnea MCA 4105]